MVTIKDVAKEAGLAVGTVSRILNQKGYISEQSKAKVEAAMKKLNYTPNEAARSLQRKKTNTIGVIVPHISHPYFAEMIHYLEQYAATKGYRILLGNSQYMDERAREYIDICRQNRVAGMILCSGSLSVQGFQMLEIPLITLERPVEHATASVECENKRGGALAADCLIDAGCRHLLHFGGQNSYAMPADQRKEGFVQVCEKRGVSCVEVGIGEEAFLQLSYEALIDRTLREHPDIDGIFANSDVIAAQVLQSCHRLQISVPEQMKIIGFDDTMVASMVYPRLTTIHQPVREMAERAIDLLCAAIDGEEIPRQTILPVSLVKRETV